MVTVVSGEGVAVRELSPPPPPPRRSLVMVMRPVAVWSDVDSDDENEKRVRAAEGLEEADVDLLFPSCEGLCVLDAPEDSADGVTVAVCSSVRLDSVCVRSEVDTELDTVYVEDSIIVTVPWVLLTDMDRERRRVLLSCLGEYVNVNVDVAGDGVSSLENVRVSVVDILCCHDPMVADFVTLFVRHSETVASDRDVVEDTDNVPVVVILSNSVIVLVTSSEALKAVNVALDVGERYSENVSVRLDFSVGETLRFSKKDNVTEMVEVMVMSLLLLSFFFFQGGIVADTLADTVLSDCVKSPVNVSSDRLPVSDASVRVSTSVSLHVFVGVCRGVREVVLRRVAVPVSVAEIISDTLTDTLDDTEESGVGLREDVCDVDQDASSVRANVTVGVAVEDGVTSFVRDGVYADGLNDTVVVVVTDIVIVTV